MVMAVKVKNHDKRVVFAKVMKTKRVQKADEIK